MPESWNLFKRRFVIFLLKTRIQFFNLLFFWKPAKNVSLFFAQHAADSLFPLSPEEQNISPYSQKCLHCSFCTPSCKAIQQGLAGEGFEPKQLFLPIHWNTGYTEVFTESKWPCTECDGCTVQCPVGVPIHALAGVLQKRRERLGFRRE